ncbi:hypothetical protein CYMTET_33340 [Cymbomonas tetramitiformis]|uniref:Uncharacterized protein n=1 Tax=Cymbomonas tetramitiformis TaxID=36881 RepID=A0AAE0KQZ8_9CHLO|nr:hypothetical protein CYMTET_33340 [Cymbomonas tetramitiformis]
MSHDDVSEEVLYGVPGWHMSHDDVSEEVLLRLAMSHDDVSEEVFLGWHMSHDGASEEVLGGVPGWCMSHDDVNEEALLPIAMGFAAGCMIWMVFAELLPEALEETEAPTVATYATLAAASLEAFRMMLSSGERPA